MRSTRTTADGVARHYAPDVEVREAETGSVLVQRRDALRSRLAELFRAHPEVGVDADSRQYQEHGCVVRDHEIVTGLTSTPSAQWVQYELDPQCRSIARVRLSRFP